MQREQFAGRPPGAPRHAVRRSVAPRALPAANMAAGVRKVSRVRRDLTADEIESLFAPDDLRSALSNDGYAPRADAGEFFPQESGEYAGGEEESTAELLREEEAAEERLAILQYLYETGGAEGAVDEPADSPPPDDVQPVRYTPVVYQGEMGLFVPLKRQYMSLVPGVRKRAAAYGGGTAYVDEQTGRNLDEYKRLYALAMALNGGAGWARK